MRDRIARVRNCIAALAARGISIYDSSIIYAYDASLRYAVADLLQADAIEEITMAVRAAL